MIPAKTIIALCSILLIFCGNSYGQSEVITNSKIIEMTKAGLSTDVILIKIKTSVDRFDITSDALIELKKAEVDDLVITAIVEVGRTVPIVPQQIGSQVGSRAGSFSPVENSSRSSLLTARTIAIQKSSLNPSRQALEKELLKRPEWKSLDLTIEQYKQNADLYTDIGFVPLSLLTHRYVYRIYDRRSGVVLAAGETTSWGSLAENLARHISRSLVELRG